MSRPAISTARRLGSIANLLLELQAERNAILVVVTHSEAMAAALQRRMEIDSGRLVARVIELPVAVSGELR